MGDETYEPSERFDSGMTRSSVLGSTAMPDGVVSGNRSGLDIARREEREEDQVEVGVSVARLDSLSLLARHHPLYLKDPVRRQTSPHP